MNIGSSMGIDALAKAVESFQKAERLMLRAVEAVNKGDIVEAALAVNEAKLTAKGAAAVARSAAEVSETLLDIFA